MSLSLAGTVSDLNELLNDSSNLTWTNAEKEHYVTAAVHFLSRGRRPKVWVEGEDETVLSTENVDAYNLPSGFFLIAELWLERTVNSSPVCYDLIRNFRIWNDQFRVGQSAVPCATGLKFRIKGIKKFTSITEVPEEYEDIILDYAQHRAFTDISNHLTKFNTYSAKLQNISRSDVVIRAREHLTNASRALAENSRPLPPVYMGSGEY